MKKLPTIAIFSVATCTSLIAHEGHSHPPKGKPVTEVVRTGQKEFTYETVPGFGKIPSGAKLGPTHGGVAVDKNGLIYTSTDGEQSIAVFKPDGTFVKAMSPELTGIHGLNIVTEGDKQYIYCAQLKKNRVVKLDLEGNIALTIPNDNTGEIPGGTKGLTAVAAAPDGSIFVSMGYGSNKIHKFDKTGKLIKSWGGRGKEEQLYSTPHGLGIDMRYDKPRLLVCDRAKRRLVHLDLDGNWIGVHTTGLRRPCAVSFHGDHAAIAELEARVAIVDKEGKVVSVVGDNSNKKQWANFRVKPEDQKPGIFTAPHGLSFDKDGNLYVQDWNATGRITKLKRIREAD
ncbi:MAG: 6-bladed beta-propeller [Akkermansiaceae bacterium]